MSYTLKNRDQHYISTVTHFLLIALVIVCALTYRLTGVSQSVPFWVDEFSSGIQARAIAKSGLNAFSATDPKLEHNNIVTHIIIAGSFKLFGESEQAARLPIAVIGTLVTVGVYLVARKLFSFSVALSAAMLTAFIYPEILWSVQARGYVLLQLLVLLTLWLYLSLLSKSRHRVWEIVGLVMCVTLGILTHSMYVLLLIALVVHFIAINWRKATSISKSTLLGLGLLLICIMLILLATGSLAVGWSFLSSSLFGANNLWYYHSFLWGEYGLIVFLSAIGLLLGLLHKFKLFSALVIYILIHLVFITFGYAHYLSKYALPILPLLIIGAAVTIDLLATSIASPVFSVLKNINAKTFSFLYKDISTLNLIFCLGISLFIIVNGHQFVTKPKAYYSLNRDFREIANIDYHQVYAKISDSISRSNERVLVIETWPDRALWYLGNDYPNVALFRWQDEGGVTSGHAKITPFELKPDGSKFLPWRPGTGFIGKAADLELATQKYKKGFIWIDDATLPADVIEYAQTHLKKELYLDHYPLDDNPYSIWPGTLYSWGVDS